MPDNTRHLASLSRLELALIELRWLGLLLALLLVSQAGRPSLPTILLLGVGLSWSLIRTLVYLAHPRHEPPPRLTLLADLLLFGGLAHFSGEPRLALFLLVPILLSVVRSGLTTALLAASGATLVVAFSAADWAGPFLLASAGSAYLVARVLEFNRSATRGRSRLQHDYERSRARLTALLDGIGDGLIAVDRNRRVTLSNLAATHLVGQPEADLRGQHLEKLLPITKGIDPYDLVANTFRTGSRELRDDLELRTGHQTVRLSTSVAPILSESGDIDGAIILLRDVTEQKEAEEERTAFASIAAHELRTPVTVIEGYLSYLLSSPKLAKDAPTRSYIQKAHVSVLQLTALIGDILQVTRSDSGQLRPALESVDLLALIAELTPTFERKAKEKKIKFEAKLPRQLPLIRTDPSKVREIITNYLDNSIKFTDSGAVILRVAVEKDELLIEVEDSGPGISPPDQARIWQKFYRTESWRTRRTGGTGLGLYISKRLAEVLGGEVGLSSEEGKGSTFFFTLPLEAKPTESQMLEPAAKHQVARTK